MSTGPVLGSLCTGYGGLDLGVLAALGGGRIAWCADPDPHVQQILAVRMPDVPNLGDLRSIDWTTVIFNMLTIKGVYGREMYETWYKMTVMLQSGLNISPVITHRFPYREWQSAFDLMLTGNTGKVILNWHSGI